MDSAPPNPLVECRVNSFGGERERVDADPAGIRDRVGDRRRDRGDVDLAGGARPVGPRSAGRVDVRHAAGRHVHLRRQLVLAEIEVLDTSLLDHQLLGDGMPESHHEGAVDLAAVCDRVDDRPDFHHERDVVDAERAGLAIDRDLDGVAAEVEKLELTVLVIAAVAAGDGHARPGLRGRQLRLQFAGAVERGLTDDVRRAAAADPRVERYDVGRAARHPDPFGVDPELAGDDALDDRQRPHAGLDHADVGLYGAVGMGGKHDVAGAAADVTRDQRDAAAAAGRERRRPLHLLAQPLEDLLDVRVGDRVAVDVGLAVGDRVAQPELERIDPQLARDHVEVRFEGEQRSVRRPERARTRPGSYSYTRRCARRGCRRCGTAASGPARAGSSG